MHQSITRTFLTSFAAISIGCTSMAQVTIGWDPKFSGYGPNGLVTEMCTTASGIVFAGNFDMIGCIPAKQIGRYRPGTDTWEAFGDGIDGTIVDVAEWPAGSDNVLVAGNFVVVGHTSIQNLALWDASLTVPAWVPWLENEEEEVPIILGMSVRVPVDENEPETVSLVVDSGSTYPYRVLNSEGPGADPFTNTLPDYNSWGGGTIRWLYTSEDKNQLFVEAAGYTNPGSAPANASGCAFANDALDAWTPVAGLYVGESIYGPLLGPRDFVAWGEGIFAGGNLVFEDVAPISVGVAPYWYHTTFDTSGVNDRYAFDFEQVNTTWADSLFVAGYFADDPVAYGLLQLDSLNWEKVEEGILTDNQVSDQIYAAKQFGDFLYVGGGFLVLHDSQNIPYNDHPSYYIGRLGPVADWIAWPLGCPADVNHDDEIDLVDFFAFFDGFDISCVATVDLNRDGVVDLNDFFCFFCAFDSECEDECPSCARPE